MFPKAFVADHFTEAVLLVYVKSSLCPVLYTRT